MQLYNYVVIPSAHVVIHPSSTETSTRLWSSFGKLRVWCSHVTHCDHAHLHCLEEEGTQQRGPGKGQFSQCRLGVGQGAELQLPLDNSLLPLTTDIHTDTHRILKAISKYTVEWTYDRGFPRASTTTYIQSQGIYILRSIQTHMRFITQIIGTRYQVYIPDKWEGLLV